ncbi:hypothetical protein IKG02_01380 [Candidatus Saccharibacteria bacterium]|nr:hypothetical protein [Candidatus Saccharibacteria bacterium]
MSKSKNYIRRRPFYKTPLFVVFLMAFILTSSVFLTIKFFPSRSSSIESDASSLEKKPETPSENSSSSTLSNLSGETPSAFDDNPDGKTPQKYEGENPNAFESLTGFVTFAGRSGGKFLVRVSIDQYLSSGSCSLTLSDGKTSLEKSADIVPEASTSTCAGFDLSEQEISSLSGNLDIKILLSSGEKTGTITGEASL